MNEFSGFSLPVNSGQIKLWTGVDGFLYFFYNFDLSKTFSRN